MLVDLHSHTNMSDGQYSPSDMIKMAYRKGIRYYSITDHDTVDGLEEAVSETEKLKTNSFVFIPGIEISTQDIIEIHIVGLGIDYSNIALINACSRFKCDRDDRGSRICDYLKSKNIHIDYKEIKEAAGSANLGRMHFAEFLSKKGYVIDRREAFKKFLDTEEFHKKVDRVLPIPIETVRLIHEAGGMAILAHPGIYGLSEKQLLDLITRLKEIGIDGIECFYSMHSDEQTREFIELSIKYELLISCGSDFHGEKVKSHINLGMSVVDEQITVINKLI